MNNDTTLVMRSLEGQVIAGRYRLDRYLAEGGFGAVFHSTQIVYGVPLREVAVKVSKHPMSDTEAQRTFSDALLMAKVVSKTPNAAIRDHFVTVFDAGRCGPGDAAEDHPYMVMEYVHGGSVGQYLRSGPFPLKRAVAYFSQMLNAVAFMHTGMEKPVAHRDLKPDNFLVARRSDASDLVKVTDFGLAIEVEQLLGWVESGGDLAYLAPESFSHNISSPKSDVYMLGLVFYEMITGVNPFAQVGVHLKGNDEAQRQELRQLHLMARQKETFALMEQNLELRQSPALIMLMREVLEVDMGLRRYRHAGQLEAAWKKAIGRWADATPSSETPWDTTKRLVAEAAGCFAIADTQRGDDLLSQALEILQDNRRVPDAMVVGKAYLLGVERLLAQGQLKEAASLAHEGYQRRKCRSCAEALAAYYRAVKSPLAASFEQEALKCKDQD